MQVDHGNEPRQVVALPINPFLSQLVGCQAERVGFRGPFFLNILLTLLGYVPGIIHALYIIIKVK